MKLVLPGLLLWTAGLCAEPAVVINTLPSRPVFTVNTAEGVVTRTVAPGNRAFVEAGKFSGLGEKQVALHEGGVYYLARFGGLPGLYQLGEDQALVLNQSGTALQMTLAGQATASGYVANGAFGLGALDEAGRLTLEWGDAGQSQVVHLAGGKVYRLVLDSPEGVGTAVSLIPWD